MKKQILVMLTIAFGVTSLSITSCKKDKAEEVIEEPTPANTDISYPAVYVVNGTANKN